MANLSDIVVPSNVLTAVNTQTVTNKTISFSGNTLTGVAPLASPTFTGTVTLPSGTSLATPTFTGTSTIATADQLGPVRGSLTAVAALDIDCSLGNFFTKTISANSTFTFSNPPSSRAYAFTLELTHTSGTVTWPTTVRWPGGTAPTLTTSRVHLFTFVTDDAGTNWRGAFQTNYTA
jgi:hypothetical protein